MTTTTDSPSSYIDFAPLTTPTFSPHAYANTLIKSIADNLNYQNFDLKILLMSMLTQELQRTKLGEHSKPVGASRSLSSGSNTAGRNGLIERGISSNSLGRETIEEEQGLFSMEEEESEPSSSVNFAAKPVGPIGTK